MSQGADDALGWERHYASAKAAETIEGARVNMEREIERRVNEALGEATPPVPQPLTFDIVWFDPDRSPTMFVGITGSGIDNGFLTLHADRITHLVNLSGVSHVNIWEERDG